jgi:hypothetical protein
VPESNVEFKERQEKFGAVADIIIRELLTDPAWHPPLHSVGKVLADRGVQFFSPGGSVQRRLVVLTTQALFEEDASRRDALLEDPEVANAIKPFLDVVAQRLLPSK